MAEGTAPDGLELLSQRECRRLLGLGGVGRLAVPAEGAPEIRPVNFVLASDEIVVRTGEGMILEAARRGDAVAFEIDAIDRVEHTGWSVIVTGKLRARATDESTRALPLRAWASRAKDQFVSIALENVAGRRIALGGGLA